jgi:GWxTD domain-containing protein
VHRRILPWVGLALLAAAALMADGLLKYKRWGSSTVSYFMTKTERQQWATIKTDAEAEAFVNRFVASRGAGFVDEVARRSEIADKYLTLGRTAGSRSIRGKIVLLLGPPKALNVADRRVAGERSATAGAYLNVQADGGPSMDDMSAGARREGMSGRAVREYTFTYPDLSVTVEADAASGADRVVNKNEAARLEQALEKAAEAPVVITRPIP